MTTIRVSPELSKEIDDKKKLYNFNSKEETIAFALSLLKTKEELLLDSLTPLREQLYPINKELYEEIEEKIEELATDPFQSMLRERLKAKIRGGSSLIMDSEFKTMCRDIGIPTNKWKDYALSFKIKWED